MGTLAIDGTIVSDFSIIFFVSIFSAISLALYLLRSIGLFVLARKNDVSLPFLAFIPGVWMFTACKIIGKTRFFGMTFEKIALIAAIVFSLSVYLSFAFNVLSYFPYIGYFFSGGSVNLANDNGAFVIITGGDFVNPFGTDFVKFFLRISSAVSYLLSIAEIFITITVYLNLFKKFWPEHYIIASVLSFFGLFPIFVFIIRNRKPVDYMEYVRSRYYGAGYSPYGNGNGGNGYGNANNQGNYQNGNNSGDTDKDPFGEFSNRPEDPFGEFSEGDKNGKDGNNNQTWH